MSPNPTEVLNIQAVTDVIVAADAVTDWYDRNDEAKANRRDFPATTELTKLNARLRETVRRWRLWRETDDVTHS